MSAVGLRLDTLAAAKGLPLGHLQARGWRNGHAKGVKGTVVCIPWPKRAGPDISNPYHVRRRIGKDGDGPRWVWDIPHGVELDIYGADLIAGWLARAEAKGRVPACLICESESDAEACALHDVPALATGGAQFWKTAWAGTVLTFEKVYMCQEPDDASSSGVLVIARNLLAEAKRLGPKRDIRIIRFTPEAKDPGALHLAVNGDQAAFHEALTALISVAVPATEVVANAPDPVASRPYQEPDGRREAPLWLEPVFQALVSFLEQRGYAPRWKSDGGVTARCPLHDDRNPSLSIHPTRGWKCFGPCGKGKLTALAARLGIRLVEAVA